MARRLHHVSYILYLLSIISIHGAVLRRTWTTQPWCESVRKPQWPFAYQKTATQTLEWQGRVNPNDQDIRHQCSVFGVQSKCHMCENFACNGDSGDRCAFQFQGVPWSALPKNIPTVTDVPWAAKRFVLNVASRSSSNFRALRGNYDSATAARNCDTYRCPQYDVELVANDGRSFQTGCSVGDPEPNPKRSAAFTSAQQIQNLLDYRDDLNVARVSDEFLCGNIVWHQGDIESNNGTNRVTRTNYVNVTKVDDVTWEYGISTPGEGVYECFNSGACVAPDECLFDPICNASVVANDLNLTSGNITGIDVMASSILPKAVVASVRSTLFTVDELKVETFRTDPCGTKGGRWGKEIVNGAMVGQGIEDANGNFQTCHLQIYVPSAWRRYTVSFVAILSVLGMIILVAWYYIRKRVRRALLLAKAERRRSRKNSEENLNKPKLGAFTHAKND
ncbi:hypothetical protein JG687_00000249 [Phytophthora cactorum]|uniref:Uncharacterized protein n=1 Tax=Phytophthora cactorum TaxID=29920 RepID=A0A8T1V171_9STRA|nr:hypothetical protein JG687_00000249 [Phytophthora cactorum]